MATSEITLEAVPSVSDIPAAEWDACANPKPDPDSLDNFDTLASSATPSDSCVSSRRGYNPFVSHAFFTAAEA
ncbi:MAG TPA: GNAT family N-acetyltransferase, partial [Bradyrhizobium sp.]|nr:GNAT family N-acetyltransferase [Bradyrhizobium sp.]